MNDFGTPDAVLVEKYVTIAPVDTPSANLSTAIEEPIPVKPVTPPPVKPAAPIKEPVNTKETAFETAAKNLVEKPAAAAAAATTETVVDDDPENDLTPEEQAMADLYSPKSEETKTTLPEAETKNSVPKQAETPPAPGKKVEIPDDIKTELQFYRKAAENPLLESVFSFIREGGTSPIEFVRKMGIRDPDKMELVDFIAMEVDALGIKDPERRKDMIDEELAQFEGTGMTAYQKEKKLLEYKANFEKNQSENLKKYSVTASQEEIRIQELSRNSHKIADEKVAALVNNSKLYKESGGKQGELYAKNLLIDETMAAEIRKLAPLYTPQLTDDSGKLVEYDIQDGIDRATDKLYRDKIYSNIWKTAEAVTTKKLMKERHRPAADSSTTGAAPQQTDKTQENLNAYKAQTGMG